MTVPLLMFITCFPLIPSLHPWSGKSLEKLLPVLWGGEGRGVTDWPETDTAAAFVPRAEMPEDFWGSALSRGDRLCYLKRIKPYVKNGIGD